MSFTLNFEADRKVSREDVLSALESSGVDCFVEEKFGLSGNFSDSNMHFVLFDRNKTYWNENSMRSSAITEGVEEPAGWDIGIRISFQCVPERYAECSNEVHNFLRRLSELSSGRYLLSFQYENLYAVHDENGLVFLEEF